MNKVALISLYFGKFPANFGLWLKSAARNADIDFLLYGDCDVSAYLPLPPNVKCFSYTFEQMKAKIQSKFDFTIELSRPYKLCDYKPIYGYLFEEDLAGYDYWDHIDLDTILGDLRAYFPKEAYEKVYQFGHLTMYRNTPENNRRFMADVGQDYRKSFTTSFITVFDELPGMKKKYDLLGIPQYSGHDFADIARRRKNFTLNSEICRKNYKYQIFYYQDGRVFRDYLDKGTMHTDEFNYIHFSKRQMPDHTGGSSAYYITRFGCVPKTGATTPEIIRQYNRPTPVQNLFCAIDTQVIRRIKRYSKLIYYKVIGR